MGLKDIVVIVEDAFLLHATPHYEDEVLCTEVGKAVLKASDQLRQITTKRRYAPVFNHANAAQFVDQVDQTMQRVYFWGQNCLRPLSRLDDQTLEIVERLVKQEQNGRAAGKK